MIQLKNISLSETENNSIALACKYQQGFPEMWLRKGSQNQRLQRHYEQKSSMKQVVWGCLFVDVSHTTRLSIKTMPLTLTPHPHSGQSFMADIKIDYFSQFWR